MTVELKSNNWRRENIRKKIFLFFWLSVIASCHSGHPFTYPYKNDSVSKKGNLLNQLFQDGDYLATLITYKELSTEQKKLLRKFNRTFEKNKGLQNKYDTIFKHPELINLKHDFGVNQHDIKVFESIFIKRETKTESDTLRIYTQNDVINFKGTGRLSFLDSLSIVPSDTTAWLNDGLRADDLRFYSFQNRQLNNSRLYQGEYIDSSFTFYYAPFALVNIMRHSKLVVGRLRPGRNILINLSIHDPKDSQPLDPFYDVIITYRNPGQYY